MANQGTMPAPHQHVAIRVNRWFEKFCVEYTGTPEQLRAAGIVDTFMEEKIINQRAGAMRDRNGVWFTLSERPKRAAWERGDVLTLTMAPYPSDLLSLPGMPEMFPNGVPEYVPPEAPRVPWAAGVNGDLIKKQRPIGRFQRLAEWASLGNVIWPNWSRVSAK